MSEILSSNSSDITSKFCGEDSFLKGMESWMSSITPPSWVDLSAPIMLKLVGRSSLSRMFSESQVSVMATMLNEEEYTRIEIEKKCL